MNGISAYQENTVTTQSKGQVVVMLYEGAIRFCRQAVQGIEQKDYAEKTRRIHQAIAIVDELNAALDMEAGGEICTNLRSLYDFMSRHLNEADLKADPHRIREVIGLLEELKEGWRAVAE